MIVLGIILYPPSADLTAFLIFIIGGGLFVICGIVLLIFDLNRNKKTADT